ncbi:hypothetical protein AVEN_141468-1 [Araneus ventricosus]|uniref:Uncharacterized protein n=1 Tax=Araneus ventricosus TaxID=182803 RepID=A0A4Y2T1I6_ARAVE|nr:hypothetical protein AVEN_141468-1 [Araneus ventricosus]
MTRTTPELVPPLQASTPTGGHLATTNYLACNRPHTRRIFSGIGSRNMEPSGSKAETLPPAACLILHGYNSEGETFLQRYPHFFYFLVYEVYKEKVM